MLDTVADLIRVGPMAADHGINVLVENHEDFDGPTLARIMEAVDHPNIGLLYDYGNSQMVGEDPLDCLEAMAPWIRNVHLKDHVITTTIAGDLMVQGVPVGQGNLPIAETTNRLYNHGVRRFCFESVWGYNAPVPHRFVARITIVHPRSGPPDHGRRHGLPEDAMAGEQGAFDEGLEACRTLLAANDYSWG